MSDIESDDDIPELSMSPSGNLANGHNASGINLDDDRRAHHNALERKRRDHIKDSFSMLREVVPTLKGEKASRALILKKAADYIYSLKANISNHQKDIAQIKRQNAALEAELNALEGQQVQPVEQTTNVQQKSEVSTNVSPPVDNVPALPSGDHDHLYRSPNAAKQQTTDSSTALSINGHCESAGETKS